MCYFFLIMYFLQVLKLLTDMRDSEAMESWRMSELQSELEDFDDYAII